jgi:hypothetical protein
VPRISHVSADTKLVVDFRFRSNESIIAFQLVTISDSLAALTMEFYRTEQNNRKEFKGTVGRSSRVKGQFTGRSSSSSEKAVRVGVQEPSQPKRFVGPGRRVSPVGT